MKETFYKSPRISKSELAALMKRLDGPAILRFSIQYLLYLAGAFGIVYFAHGNIGIWMGSFALFSLMSLAMFAATHECGHNTAFATKSFNKIALWLSAAVTLYTPTGFCQFHFAHHRHTHDPNLDPEIAPTGKPLPVPTSDLPTYLVWSTGIPIVLFKTIILISASIGPAWIWKNVMPWVGKAHRNRCRWESRIVLSLHIALLLAGLCWLPALLWLFLAQIMGHTVVALYITAEHNGLPHEGNILDRTRSIRTNIIVRFLAWNMPYHAEHHAYPAIPYHALPALHKLMRPELKHRLNGYPLFHSRAISQLVRRKPFKEK